MRDLFFEKWQMKNNDASHLMLTIVFDSLLWVPQLLMLQRFEIICYHVLPRHIHKSDGFRSLLRTYEIKSAFLKPLISMGSSNCSSQEARVLWPSL